ncbi:RNA-directed DNA polymerase from mobile element jockey [Trichonephila clavipes]|uniref:RNA-directed DNA polymerase from mobile element jockey n=1 Tax=Trichonephila clavipes TaxID=2585209 RepID=A0A8X6VBP0_TRICX|nr:RNA-directed DNA polymerase from mobile element jockey [Trichonephila clavipes]
MEAKKQQPQTSISTPAPPTSANSKPQSTAPQPAITRPTPKPRPDPETAPQPFSPTTSQEPSLTNTLKDLQSPKSSVNCLELTFNPLHRDKLHIVSWNADGIQRKIEELENYINDNSSDIIALQETNLRPCIDLNIPNYSTHRNDRLTHRGGGTAILVKNSIAHHVINIYTTAVNITAIEIEGPTNNITVCSLYRSPSSPINSFIPDLIKIFRNRAQCIVVGDYNARHPTWNPNRRGNTAGTRLFHYANTCGLVISAPTDFTKIPQQQNHQPSVIDLGVSCGINNIAVESRYDLSSDHNPVHFVVKFNFKTSHLLNCKTITNWNKFQDILSTTIAGNPPINNTEEIDEAISKLNYNIHTALNQSSKFKSMKQDFTLVPYATRMKITRGKNRLRKLWQQNHYPPLKTELNRLQRDIKKDLLNIKQREWDDAPSSNAATRTTRYTNSLPERRRNLLSIPPARIPRPSLRDKRKADLIEKYTLDNSIIPDIQHGFRKETSTCHQLLRATNIIISGFNNHATTGGIFLDVEKAFDRLWHNGLIFKMINLNYPPYLIHTISDYLHNRIFQVKIQATISKIGHIQAGSPQGSLLSPILYNIYTYDFPTSPLVDICLFADDAAILSQQDTPQKVRASLQKYLKKLKKWLTLWRISINTSKSKAIVFKKGAYKNTLQPLKLFRNNIDWHDEVDYLGVTLDKKLTFKSHLKKITCKFKNRLQALHNLLSKNSKLSTNNKRQIYMQYLLPILTYASQIWGITSNRNLDRIQILQNRALRLILNAPTYIKRIHIHKDLKIPALTSRIKKLATAFYEQVNAHSNSLINIQAAMDTQRTHNMPIQTTHLRRRF